MGGFGIPEMIALAIMGVIMFGPEKVPEFARKAARLLHFLRGVANNATSQLREELGPEYADLKITDLHPRTFVAKHLLGDIQDDLDEIKQDLGTLKQDLEEEGRDTSAVDEALDRVEQTSTTVSSARKTTFSPSSEVGNYWTDAPFDPEAT